MMKLTFETALVYLKQGKKIRRAFWPKDIYLERGVVAFDEDKWEDLVERGGEPYTESWFCTSDILEDDWEVIE